MEIKGKKVKVQIWDTAGGELLEIFGKCYLKGANGALLLYNITDRSSFESLNFWLTDSMKNINKDLCKILVGTNCDLEDERKVTYQEGKEFATSNGMKFIEVSTKNNVNVQEAFDILLEDVLNNIFNENKVDEKKDRHVHTPENIKKEKENCYLI